MKKAERVTQVLKRVSFSRSTLYRKIKDGTFPKPFNLTARAIAWDSRDIDAYLDARGEWVAENPESGNEKGRD